MDRLPKDYSSRTQAPFSQLLASINTLEMRI